MATYTEPSGWTARSIVCVVPSKKVVNLSALPSPSVSSSTRMRSNFGPVYFAGRKWVWLSTTSSRPFASKSSAIG